MAPKTCKLSVATCEKNIFLHKSESSYPEIAKKLNLNFFGVFYVIKKKTDNDSTINKPGTGCLRQLDQAKDSHLKRILRKKNNNCLKFSC